MEVLDEAVSLRRELLVLRPLDHRYRAADVDDLVVLLERRCAVTGDDRDRGEIDELKAELAALDDECEDPDGSGDFEDSEGSDSE